MAYPTGVLSRTLDDIDRRAAAIKSYCTQVRAAMAVGDVSASVPIDLYIRLRADRAALAAAAAVPGIVQYARDQKNNQGLDVVAEFSAMTAAIDAVTTQITTVFPVSGGFLLREQWSASGTTERAFSSAATANLRTLLDTLIATIA